jgi:hypothetical protein
MDKADVKQIVNDEIRKFISDSLDKEMKKMLHNKTATRDELISTIRNSMEAVYRTLWQKREIWRDQIK